MCILKKRRTSFALGGETISAIRRLSRWWGVSQAEVVRRAVKRAAEQEESEELSVKEHLEHLPGRKPPYGSPDQRVPEANRGRSGALAGAAMTLLDTNYRIRALVAGTPEAERVDRWLNDE